jgi:hypothetical protein
MIRMANAAAGRTETDQHGGYHNSTLTAATDIPSPVLPEFDTINMCAGNSGPSKPSEQPPYSTTL